MSMPATNSCLPLSRPSAPTSSASCSPTTAATCWPAGPAPISPSAPSCSWEPVGRWGLPVAVPGGSAALLQTDRPSPPCSLQGPGTPVMRLLSHSLQSGRGRCPYSPRQPFAALLVGKSGVPGDVGGLWRIPAAPCPHCPTDGQLYSGTSSDFMGSSAAFFRTEVGGAERGYIRTEQHQDHWLHGTRAPGLAGGPMGCCGRGAMPCCCSQSPRSSAPSPSPTPTTRMTTRSTSSSVRRPWRAGSGSGGTSTPGWPGSARSV